MPHRDKKTPEHIREEIIRNQKFSMDSAMGRDTQDPQKKQNQSSETRDLENQLRNFVKSRLKDPWGALKSILYKHIKGNRALVAEHKENPMQALQLMIENLLDDEIEFREFVREVDLEWGRIYQEHPHFQNDDEDAEPEDEYTQESVEKDLRHFLSEVSTQL
jgi:hypothetical protein